MLDRNGDPIIVGADYAMVGAVQSVDADEAVLDVGPRPVVAAPDRLLPASAFAGLIDERLHRWLLPMQLTTWFSSALSGWGVSLSGTGVSYVPQGRYFSAIQALAGTTVVTCDAADGTAGTNAVARYQANAGPVYLADGVTLIWQCNVENFAEAAQIRIGFAGDGAVPGASGRVSSGLWAEFDVGVDATNWGLCAGASGSYGTDVSVEAVATGEFRWFALQMVSSSSARLFRCTPAGATQVAEVTTNLPSSTIERNGRLWWQMVKRTSGATSGRPHCQVGRFGILEDGDALPVLP